MQSLDKLVENLYNQFTAQALPKPTISRRCRATSAMKQQQPKTVMLRIATKSSHQSLRFTSIIQIASGAYSTVHKAYDNILYKNIAIKRYQKFLPHFERRYMLLKEERILNRLDHENIVKCFGVYGESDLLLEYIEGVTLTEYIKINKIIEESEALIIYKQLRKAISYIHSQGVSHRDLKSDNVIINSLNIKLIDFGLANENQILCDQSGTPSYMAPETFRKRPYDGRRADLWSLGVLLYYICCGVMPFKGRNEQQIQHSQMKLHLPKHLSDSMKRRITILLNKDPLQRQL